MREFWSLALICAILYLIRADGQNAPPINDDDNFVSLTFEVADEEVTLDQEEDKTVTTQSTQKYTTSEQYKAPTDTKQSAKDTNLDSHNVVSSPSDKQQFYVSETPMPEDGSDRSSSEGQQDGKDSDIEFPTPFDVEQLDLNQVDTITYKFVGKLQKITDVFYKPNSDNKVTFL